MASPRIALKRVYEAPGAADGARILVERLWPRGLSKADAALDHWIKDIAPSAGLRTWFGHRPERWDEFRRRYRLELADNRVAVDDLRKLCAGQAVTFVFAARDTERNGAVVLREFLSPETAQRALVKDPKGLPNPSGNRLRTRIRTGASVPVS